MSSVCPGRDLVTQRLRHLLPLLVGHLSRRHGDSCRSLLAGIRTPHHRSSISYRRGAMGSGLLSDNSAELKPTSKPKPNRSSTPSKASCPVSVLRHLHRRSTRTSLKSSPLCPASSLSTTTPSHPPLPSRAKEILSEHANELSEVQAMPEAMKESRQIMAK